MLIDLSCEEIGTPMTLNSVKTAKLRKKLNWALVVKLTVNLGIQNQAFRLIFIPHSKKIWEQDSENKTEEHLENAIPTNYCL